jgi:aspartate racemase
MDNSIVIIGGMGPQASLLLHKLVVEGSGRHHNGDPADFPLIMHASLPVPDFVASPKNYQAALTLVQAACKQLPIKSAAAIGIACNTAHLMVDDLPLVNTNFVSMLDEVVDIALKRGDQTIGLLASPHTVKTKLYQKKFAAKGIGVIEPNADELVKLNGVIHDVIAGKATANSRAILSTIARNTIDQGAQSIVLGCTELPIVGLEKGIPAIDSLQVLAEALLNKYYK